MVMSYLGSKSPQSKNFQMFIYLFYFIVYIIFFVSTEYQLNRTVFRLPAIFEGLALFTFGLHSSVIRWHFPRSVQI